MPANIENKKSTPRVDVSICVATCNQLRYIQQCLESVLTQTGTFSWELLVGDDCSDDGSSALIAQLVAGYNNAHHIRHASRKGASANMQHLFGLAQGRFVAHLDGDDYWLPTKLEKQIAFLDAHPQCVAVYTNALVIDDNNNFLALFNDAGDRLIDLTTLLTRGNFLNNSSMMLRREQAAAFNSIDYASFLDFEGHLLHARAGWLGHLGEPLASYRANAQGSLVATANDQMRHMYLRGITNVPPEEIPNSVRTQALADFLRRAALHAIHTRNPRLLAYWWRNVTRHAPQRRANLAIATAKGVLKEIGKQVIASIRRSPRILYRC